MGYYPQESLYKPYKYHGYTVRGTPNCPLNTNIQGFANLTSFIQGEVFLFGDVGDVGMFFRPPQKKSGTARLNLCVKRCVLRKTGKFHPNSHGQRILTWI